MSGNKTPKTQKKSLKRCFNWGMPYVPKFENGPINMDPRKKKKEKKEEVVNAPMN
jgi:hypothetical protein